MKRSNRPAYWQLDLFMLAMVFLMVLLMRAQLAATWEVAAEVAWSILTIAGMGLWVRANWAALRREERERPQRTPYLAHTQRWPARRTIISTRVLVRPHRVHALHATPHAVQERHNEKQQGKNI